MSGAQGSKEQLLRGRIEKVRRELTKIERLLMSLGANKAIARKLVDVREGLNEVEAMTANEAEVEKQGAEK